MARGISQQQVFEAADAILAAGERPTIERVRLALGTGSPATVNAMLKEYYQALPARLHLPAPIATAAADLYEKIRSTALDEAREQRAELEREFAVNNEQLAADRRGFETEKEELRTAVVTLRGELDRQKEASKHQSLKIATLERELGQQSERAASAIAQVRAMEEERERSTQRHAAELSRLKEQSDGNERHLLGRLDDQKTQLQRHQSERERESLAFAKRLAGLEESVAESHRVIASLRAELATSQRESSKKQSALVVAEQALVKIQEQSSKETALRQAELDRARADHDRLSSASERMKRERDEAIRESAMLGGKISVLEAHLAEMDGEIRRLRAAR